MRAYLGRRYRLSASHRLHCAELSDEENRAVYGKCNNPHGHGHNYIVEVKVGGEVDPVTGMVCDLAQLDDCVRREILDRFGETNLNLYEGFAEQVPTTENFTMEIQHLLKGAFTKAEIVMVRVEETTKNSFEYSDSTEMGKAVQA
ncbi:MAG TPA: 6-carboxytetrahydropterin synthase [Acidobacteriaceae bacterium]|nr:6-carboxytetrahydropterin synthase [Acidobacteriaceae bacterium]